MPTSPNKDLPDMQADHPFRLVTRLLFFFECPPGPVCAHYPLSHPSGTSGLPSITFPFPPRVNRPMFPFQFGSASSQNDHQQSSRLYSRRPRQISNPPRAFVNLSLFVIIPTNPGPMTHSTFSPTKLLRQADTSTGPPTRFPSRTLYPSIHPRQYSRPPSSVPDTTSLTPPYEPWQSRCNFRDTTVLLAAPLHHASWNPPPWFSPPVNPTWTPSFTHFNAQSSVYLALVFCTYPYTSSPLPPRNPIRVQRRSASLWRALITGLTSTGSLHVSYYETFLRVVSFPPETSRPTADTAIRLVSAICALPRCVRSSRVLKPRCWINLLISISVLPSPLSLFGKRHSEAEAPALPLLFVAADR